MRDMDDEDMDLLDLFSGETRPSSSNCHPRESKRTEQQKPQSRGPSASPPPPTPPPPSTASATRGFFSAVLPPSDDDNKPRKPPAPKPPRRPPADFTEAFSGLRVRNRLLSAEDMRVRMRGRKVHRLDSLRTVPPRALESQDPADAWAAVGVLVSKSPRRQAANGGSFSVWTLSDLSRRENEVSLFLFQEALGSHWTVCEGTLIAVVGAKVLPDKGGDGGNAPQRLAFSVDSPWQVNRIGMSMDYGLCKGKRKDGKPCTMPVNKTEGGGFCEFHVVAAFNRAQRKAPVGNKTKGNTQQPALSMSAKLGASVRQQQQQQQQQQRPFQSRAGLPSRSTMPGQRAQQGPPPRAAPAPTLSSILGAGARRREGVGATRTFGSSSSSSTGGGGPSTVHAKALRPSAMRASGRTTTLSSPPPGLPGGGGGGSASRGGTTLPRSSSSSSLSSSAGLLSKSVAAAASAGRDGNGNGAGWSGNRGAVGAATAGAATAGGGSEDLLKLPWAYGDGKKPNNSSSRISSSASSGGGGGGGSGAPGPLSTGKKRKVEGRGDEEGALGKDARPPKEAHPAGYMSGSVAVPAESPVFLQMPQRCPVRQDGTRSAEGEKMLADAQVLMRQRALKQKADQRGLLLRPQDPNSASSIGKKSSGKPSGLRAGSNKRQSARPGANPLLAAGGRGGDSGDPLAKKVKTMSAVEKELLLRRVSKYAGLAEEERAKDADRSVQRLEQREAMADKAEEVTKMAVTVFACTQATAGCKTRRSRFNKHCKDLGHDQKGVKATLRFFECTNCRKRCSSTERVPRTGCESCGRHDMWKRCGARPGRGPAEGPRDKRFVAALSEWTDQRDLSLAAPDCR
ncbi:unnamed protein product [Ectocarpus sp. CCAP 1310/34]|nr:unnamed protein product [Ectocarpus sp. CCAP 1310/34]